MGKVVKKHAGDKWNDAGYQPFRLREVQYGEFVVVFPCRPVVDFGRPDFVIEATEKYISSVEFDACLPEPLFTVPGNALVFGAEGFVLVFRLISAVLSDSCRAKIRLAIVQTVAVDMVHEQIVGDSADLTVHEYLTPFSIFGSD